VCRPDKSKLGAKETMSAAIERAIAKDDWAKARSLIQSALRKEPNSHWLLTRLALTYYEEREYEKALRYSQKALLLQPNCPLALWDCAGALSMLGRHREAMDIYRRLIRRGAESIANGDCGEGIAQARGLVADCWYRISKCHLASGAKRSARIALQKHILLRGAGCRSIYSIRDVKSEMDRLAPNNSLQADRRAIEGGRRRL